jgi:hypothetical protein
MQPKNFFSCWTAFNILSKVLLHSISWVRSTDHPNESLCLYSSGIQILLFTYKLHIDACKFGLLVYFCLSSLYFLLIFHLSQYQMQNPSATFVWHTHSFDVNMNHPFCSPSLHGILPESLDVLKDRRILKESSLFESIFQVERHRSVNCLATFHRLAGLFIGHCCRR